jgi:hypothetical protein
MSKVLLIPVEPALKPRKKVTLRIGDKEYCVYEDSVQVGFGFIAFTDCSNTYRVVSVPISSSETQRQVYKPA